MRKVRKVIVLVIGSLILVSGTANADPQPDAATSVRQSHDRLVAAAETGDVAAATAAVAGLRPVLMALSSENNGLARSAVHADAVRANQANDVLAAELAALPATQQKIIPTLPGPLGTLSAFLNSLLASLLALLASLLGGGLPVPLPVPVPELPVPLPET